MQKTGNINAAPAKTSAIKDGPLDAEVRYTVAGRVFIVQPVFKENAASTIGGTLLRLMRSEYEES